MLKTYFKYKITVYGIRKIKKTRLKTENNFTIYTTVQHNKCLIRSELIMSHFLRTLEVRKMVVGCALLPGNLIIHIRQ